MDTGKVNIHGKEYKTVALRVAEFREAHKMNDGWGIVTQQCPADEGYVVIRAAITFEGAEVATGYAEEKRGSTNINRTSALENCETSAIGRALAAAGFAGTEYASADEVANAISQQQAPKLNPVEEFVAWGRKYNAKIESVGCGQRWAIAIANDDIAGLEAIQEEVREKVKR